MRSIIVLASVLVGALTAAAGEAPRRDAASGCLQCGADQGEIAERIRTADRLYSQFKPREAARELDKVLQSDPDHFEALTMMARAHIDIGDMVPETDPDGDTKRLREYKIAESYARRAVRVRPDSTWGHFYVAWALGNIALVSPVGRQIDLAGEIRGAVERALALDPNNGFAYHAYGVWHRKMAEIGGAKRLFAGVLYGRTIPQGSLEKSLEYLLKAVELNPRVIVSRLELARTYVAMENWPRARAYLTSIEALPIQFSDDQKHKRAARQLLEEINGR